MLTAAAVLAEYLGPTEREFDRASGAPVVPGVGVVGVGCAGRAGGWGWARRPCRKTL